MDYFVSLVNGKYAVIHHLPINDDLFKGHTVSRTVDILLELLIVAKCVHVFTNISVDQMTQTCNMCYKYIVDVF